MHIVSLGKMFEASSMSPEILYLHDILVRWIHWSLQMFLFEFWNSISGLLSIVTYCNCTIFYKDARYSQGVRNLEFDSHLGPYALSQFREWKLLSNYITQSTIERIRKHNSQHIDYLCFLLLVFYYSLDYFHFLLCITGKIQALFKR